MSVHLVCVWWITSLFIYVYALSLIYEPYTSGIEYLEISSNHYLRIDIRQIECIFNGYSSCRGISSACTIFAVYVNLPTTRRSDVHCKCKSHSKWFNSSLKSTHSPHFIRRVLIYSIHKCRHHYCPVLLICAHEVPSMINTNEEGLIRWHFMKLIAAYSFLKSINHCSE
jgi:hypothetical protein